MSVGFAFECTGATAAVEFDPAGGLPRHFRLRHYGGGQFPEVDRIERDVDIEARVVTQRAQPIARGAQFRKRERKEKVALQLRFAIQIQTERLQLEIIFGNRNERAKAGVLIRQMKLPEENLVGRIHAGVSSRAGHRQPFAVGAERDRRHRVGVRLHAQHFSCSHVDQANLKGAVSRGEHFSVGGKLEDLVPLAVFSLAIGHPHAAVLVGVDAVGEYEHARAKTLQQLAGSIEFEDGRQV